MVSDITSELSSVGVQDVVVTNSPSTSTENLCPSNLLLSDQTGEIDFLYRDTYPAQASCGDLPSGLGPVADRGIALAAWVIAPTGAASVTLYFSDLSTESGFDRVTITACSTVACTEDSE
eukprot:3124489-Rhodomonas_salina.1